MCSLSFTSELLIQLIYWLIIHCNKITLKIWLLSLPHPFFFLFIMIKPKRIWQYLLYNAVFFYFLSWITKLITEWHSGKAIQFHMVGFLFWILLMRLAGVRDLTSWPDYLWPLSQIREGALINIRLGCLAICGPKNGVWAGK